VTKAIDYSLLIERTCSRCGQTRPVSEFNRYADRSAPVTGWRYHTWCRSCANAESRRYGTENKSRRNERLREWRLANPEKARALDRRRRLRRYGLTQADVDSMMSAQGGRCLLCRRKVELVIDHDHSTGRVRGLICGQCNVLIGWLERPGVRSKVDAYLG
jgi:hypothetical protein